MTQTIDHVTGEIVEQSRALVPVNAAALDRDVVKATAEIYLNNKAKGEKEAGIFAADLTPIQAAQLARISLAYGLDPFLGELTIYQGRPWVTIDGRIRQAQNSPDFDGYEKPREATEEERMSYRCKPDEHMWVAVVYRKDRRLPFTAFGRAGGKYEKNYIVTHEDRGPELAQKRALSRALRMAFSLPLPGEGADGGLAVRGAIADAETTDAEMAPIGPGQSVAIHAIVGKIGLSDETYREWLEKATGKRTSKDLSATEAQQVLDMLAIEVKTAEDAEMAKRMPNPADAANRVREELAAKRATDAARLAGEPARAPTDEEWDAYKLLVESGQRLGIDIVRFADFAKDDVWAVQLAKLKEELEAEIAKLQSSLPLGGA